MSWPHISSVQSSSLNNRVAKNDTFSILLPHLYLDLDLMELFSAIISINSLLLKKTRQFKLFLTFIKKNQGQIFSKSSEVHSYINKMIKVYTNYKFEFKMINLSLFLFYPNIRNFEFLLKNPIWFSLVK